MPQLNPFDNLRCDNIRVLPAVAWLPCARRSCCNRVNNATACLTTGIVGSNNLSDVRIQRCSGGDPSPRVWFQVRVEVRPFITYVYVDDRLVGSSHSEVPASFVVGVLTPNGEGNLAFFRDMRVDEYEIVHSRWCFLHVVTPL